MSGRLTCRWRCRGCSAAQRLARAVTGSAVRARAGAPAGRRPRAGLLAQLRGPQRALPGRRRRRPRRRCGCAARAPCAMPPLKIRPCAACWGHLAWPLLSRALLLSLSGAAASQDGRRDLRRLPRPRPVTSGAACAECGTSMCTCRCSKRTGAARMRARAKGRNWTQTRRCWTQTRRC